MCERSCRPVKCGSLRGSLHGIINFERRVKSVQRARLTNAILVHVLLRPCVYNTALHNQPAAPEKVLTAFQMTHMDMRCAK